MILHYVDEYQLAIYETRLLKSDWNKEFNLSLIGLDLSATWDGFITEVSGIVANDNNTLEEQIGVELAKGKLRRTITDLENKARKETQSKKKYEMFQRIKEIGGVIKWKD